MNYDYVIVGGGPTGMTLAWILSNQKKSVLLIEKDEVLGGCHKVLRVNGYFTEHGPRVYSDSFVMFNEILLEMGFTYTDLFNPYKFKISNIDMINLINASVTSITPVAPNSITSGSYNFFIGKLTNSASHNGNYDIGETMYWTRILSTSEIKSIKFL
jgi:uncharacterized protein with NAD-binding domain and iron-sulfur cluster